MPKCLDARAPIFWGFLNTKLDYGLNLTQILKVNICLYFLTGKFMLTVFGAVAELEREYTLQRQEEGIEIAKGQGKYKGRKPIQRGNFNQIVALWQSGEITAREAMRRLDMKSSTFYRKVHEKEVS